MSHTRGRREKYPTPVIEAVVQQARKGGDDPQKKEVVTEDKLPSILLDRKAEEHEEEVHGKSSWNFKSACAITVRKALKRVTEKLNILKFQQTTKPRVEAKDSVRNLVSMFCTIMCTVFLVSSYMVMNTDTTIIKCGMSKNSKKQNAVYPADRKSDGNHKQNEPGEGDLTQQMNMTITIAKSGDCGKPIFHRKETGVGAEPIRFQCGFDVQGKEAEFWIYESQYEARFWQVYQEEVFVPFMKAQQEKGAQI